MEHTDHLHGRSKTGLIERAQKIITQPTKEWNVIAREQPEIGQIIKSYVVPLAGAAALAALIGYSIIGFEAFGIRLKGMGWGLYEALTVLLSSIMAVYITAQVLDLLAPSFRSEKDFNRSLQLVAYSFTPAWVGDLLSIFPPVAWIGGIFGLYGLYILYLGLPKLKKTPADQLTSYFVASIIVSILVYFIVGWILSSILIRIFGLSYGSWDPH